MHMIQMGTFLKPCGAGRGVHRVTQYLQYRFTGSCRDGGLVEALSDGLLRPCGVVATNFLPHVDLAIDSAKPASLPNIGSV